MSKNCDVIPFTELVERVGDLGRERVDNRSVVRGIVNDFYVRELPRKFDWNFFLGQSTITVQERYNTGTISATTGSTTVTFSSDVVLTQSNNQWQLTVQGNNYVYTFNYTNATGGTLNVPFGGTQNVVNGTYSLFQPYYSLAEDFDRFPKNGGVINYQGGQETIVQLLAYQDWQKYYNPTPAQNAAYCRIYGADTAGCQLLEINPPPLVTMSYRYDYFRSPVTMRENTAGKVVFVAQGGTTVTGDANTLFTQCNTGDYFRVDAFGTGADSEWYRIISINGNSSLTLQTAFQNTGNASVTSANYTISSSPQIPSKLHPGVLYGSLLQVLVEQDDPMFQTYHTKFAEVMSDGKRLWVSRIYNQEIHSIAEDYLYRR